MFRVVTREFRIAGRTGGQAARGVTKYEKPKVSKETIRKIERFALVGLEEHRGQEVLEAAIVFTDSLRARRVDDSVEPMYTPLEEERIPLRADRVRRDADRNRVLRNAALTEEEYFVAPAERGK